MLVRLYSKSTGCTYLPGVHDTIPDDAVEISEQVYSEVIANPASGKVRSHDSDGRPLLIDAPAPSLTLDDLAVIERTWRDYGIAATEWLVTRHRDELDMVLPTSLQPDQYSELLLYRQGMRDWPQASRFPYSDYRPKAPDWLAAQTQ